MLRDLPHNMKGKITICRVPFLNFPTMGTFIF
jgi:hypothetical protein